MKNKYYEARIYEAMGFESAKKEYSKNKNHNRGRNNLTQATSKEGRGKDQRELLRSVENPEEFEADELIKGDDGKYYLNTPENEEKLKKRKEKEEKISKMKKGFAGILSSLLR